MIIDTRTKEGMASTLSTYLDIEEDELYQYIDYAAAKAQPKDSFFNTEIFEKELLGIFSDLEPAETIDEILVYHLTRRLDEDNTSLSSDNLRTLLLSESALSSFLKKYGISFIVLDDHPVLCLNGQEVSLENTGESEVCYLRGRMGYNKGKEDYCFNGFAFRDLLMKNSYTRELYECPEFISMLSQYLGLEDIKDNYFKNSSYYCYTYKLRVKDIIFDDRDSLDDKEKIEYFIVQLCMRLLLYMEDIRRLYDDDNPVIRVADDACVSSEDLVNVEEITLDMIE